MRCDLPCSQLPVTITGITGHARPEYLSQRTVQRMRGQATVLCIHDGTDLNYNQFDQCVGLGVLIKNQKGAQTRGLHVHSNFVVSTECLPLGLLNAQFSAPQPKPTTNIRSRASIPIDEKMTFAWVQELLDCVQLSQQLPDTHQICEMDREADFFELSDEQRQTGKVDLLVRAKHDRRIDEVASHLFDSVRSTAPCGQMVIKVPRQSARPKKSKQQAKPGHEQRSAIMALRYREIELQARAVHKW